MKRTEAIQRRSAPAANIVQHSSAWMREGMTHHRFENAIQMRHYPKPRHETLATLYFMGWR
jgi:hypothetical protein